MKELRSSSKSSLYHSGKRQSSVDFEELSRIERINVVGTSGSGKSTLARQLAELLQLPCCEMDQRHWKPNWQEARDEDFLREVREVTSQQRWVLDGNYTQKFPDKLERVQLVIWLDFSLVRTVFQVTRRTLHRSISRQEVWEGTGNRETLAKAFLSKDSIILWAITSFRRNRKTYRALMASPDYSHIRFLRLESPKSVASFLERLRLVVRKQHAAEPSPHSA
jgi:adenylate kinase family enzyme